LNVGRQCGNILRDVCGPGSTDRRERYGDQGLGYIVRLEFLPHRDKSILQVGLALSTLVLACLAFGQTATSQFSGTASLYMYFASTAIILILVSLMPPNRPDRWLGGNWGAVEREPRP
jgi:hypothetical protein